jgi:hypothetical protein
MDSVVEYKVMGQSQQPRVQGKALAIGILSLAHTILAQKPAR